MYSTLAVLQFEAKSCILSHDRKKAFKKGMMLYYKRSYEIHLILEAGFVKMPSASRTSSFLLFALYNRNGSCLKNASRLVCFSPGNATETLLIKQLSYFSLFLSVSFSPHSRLSFISWLFSASPRRAPGCNLWLAMSANITAQPKHGRMTDRPFNMYWQTN